MKRSFLSLFIVSLSSVAIAQPAVDLIWSSSSASRPGSGAIGTNSINAAAGDQVFLDIVLNDQLSCLGFQTVSLSLTWNPDKLTAFATEECPAPPNLLSGLCFTAASGGALDPLFPGVDLNTPGFAFGFDAWASPGSFAFTCGVPLTLGRIGFEVQAGTQSLEVFYRPANDGVVDGTGGFSTPTASAKVLPPGC